MDNLKRGDVKIGFLAIGLVLIFTLISYALFVYTDGGSNMYPREDSSEKELQPLTIRKTAESAHSDAATYILYGADDLRTIWEMSFAGEYLPDVDFSNYMVVAAFLGERGTSGYGIEVTKAEESDTDVYVYVRETLPGPTCKVTEGEYAPMHAVKIVRSDKPVTFISDTKVTSCD